MIIIKGDIWNIPSDYKVVTTNGIVMKDRRLVMGKGIAREARDKYPYLDLYLGKLVLQNGNHVHVVYYGKEGIISFPTKKHWKDNSDIDLIKRSCLEMKEVLKEEKNITVLMPPPGCGNGGLNWEDVGKVIEPLLDDRFIVVIK